LSPHRPVIRTVALLERASSTGEINRKAEQLQIDDMSLDNPFRKISIHALWLA